jgi:hypothetical protein
MLVGSITPDQKERELDNDDGDVTYSLYNRVPDFFPHTGRWELSTNPEAALFLTVNNAAGEVLLSLADADLRSLEADQGVGRMVIRLPELKSEEIFISQAVGVIKVVIPEGISVAVDAQNGLSRVVFPPDFELDDGYYSTPRASASNADLVMVIEQALGLVTVEYSR